MAISPDTSHIITCSEVSIQNQEGKIRVVATITRDGVMVWCKSCRGEHLVPREMCEAIWSRGSNDRVMCSAISKENEQGHPKLFAKIVPDAILEWCRYCHVAHRVTREQCERVWGK